MFERNSFGKISKSSTIVFLSFALVVIILTTYMQAGNHQFLNLDDDVYVTNNSHVANGISIQNIIWAFTSFEASNWHPITWLSHMTDVQLYGMNPRGHHLTNVTIHTVSSLLLFFVLFRFSGTIWRSFFVATLFALHPLHVESVAWVAERKDVLSAFFWFLTLLSYTEYVAKQNIKLYALTLFMFVLGLMSKPMLVTLPIVMLLLDYWPLNRYRHEDRQGLHKCFKNELTIIIEKIPFFVCSLFSGSITIYAQSGALHGYNELPFQIRSENTLISYVKYISKILWPHDLAVYYPFPLSIPLWQVISSLVILIVLSTAAVRTVRQNPYFFVGWFWFLITLVPVVGVIQVGAQSMADRYTYIPAIGLFIIAAWGVPDLTKGLQHQKVILALLAGIIIVLSAIISRQQLSYWRDNIPLYQHTLQVTTDNSFIHNNLGHAFASKGDLDAAMQEFKKALQISPNDKSSHYNLGLVFQTKGDFNAAILEYQEALRISPYDTRLHNNLGSVLYSKGDLNAAIQEYKVTLRISPDDIKAHYNLGLALAQKEDLDDAVKEFQESLRINPNDIKAQYNLEAVLARKKIHNETRK